MRDLTKQLNEKVEMGTQLDEYLTNAIEKAKADGTILPSASKYKRLISPS